MALVAALRRILESAAAGTGAPVPRRARNWLLLMGCVLAVASGAGAAADGELTIGEAQRYPLSRSFTFLEDPSGELTLDEVLEPAVQARFGAVPQRGDGVNFGFTRSAIWLRLVLHAPPETQPDWLLELAYPPLDSIELYAPDGPGLDRQAGGDLRPFSARAVPHRNHVLRVTLRSGGSTTLYLRLRSQGAVVAAATLWRPIALWQHDQAVYGVLGSYFGLLVGLLLYNLLLYLSVRDSGYLIYAGFAAALGAGQAALSGMGAQFLWPQWTWLNSVLPAAAFSAAAILGVQFARHFLSSAARLPRTDRFLRLQVAGWTAALVAAVTLPYTATAWLVTVMAMLSVGTGVVVGVVSIRRQFAGARLFFTAWAVLLAGVLTLALHNAGVLPSNLFTANALLIGSAFEMVLLSFALADRINVARRFKEMAQARIAAEHALVGALSQAQQRLTNTLHEREAMLNSLVEGIVLTVPGRIEWVNRRFAQMLGYPAEALVGQSPQQLDADHDGWEDFRLAARAAIAATGSCRAERRLRRASGELFWVEMSGTCLRGRDADASVVWSVREIPGRQAAPGEQRHRAAGAGST